MKKKRQGAYWPAALRDPRTLTKLELVSVVREIQRVLWVEETGGLPKFNRNKEWNGADTLDRVVESLQMFDLDPKR